MGNINCRKLLKSLIVSIVFVAISVLILLFSRYELGDKVVSYIIFNVFLFCVPQAILFVYDYIATKDITTDTGDLISMFMMGIIVNIMKNTDKDLDFEYKNEKKLKNFKLPFLTKFYKKHSDK